MRPASSAASSLTLAATLLSLATAPEVALAWGGGEKGNGKKVTQARQVGEFSRIRLEGSLDARVQVGPARSLAVTIDENLQPLVETVVEGETLVVRTRNLSYQGEGRVDVAVPSLRAFGVEGSGDATIEGGAGDLSLAISGSGDVAWRGAAERLVAAISGSGDMRLEGTAARLEASVAGSGDVGARQLQARSAEVSVAGSGDVTVTLTGGTLRAAVAGSGDVIWYGAATVERAATAGSGGIVHR